MFIPMFRYYTMELQNDPYCKKLKHAENADTTEQNKWTMVMEVCKNI